MLLVSLSVFPTSWDSGIPDEPIKKVSLLSNEEFFSMADIIIEAEPTHIKGFTYDAGGNKNPDDLYTSTFHIVTYIYKNNSSMNILPGDTINVIIEGGKIHQLSRSKEGYLEEIKMEKWSENEKLKIPGYPIRFFKESDFPINPDVSKQNKYIKVSPVRKVKDELTGFDDLHFENRYELYKYMEQFEGVTVPLSDISKMRWDLRRDKDVFNQYLEERNIDLRHAKLQQENILEKKFQIARENKRKDEEQLRSGTISNALTINIKNQAVQYDHKRKKYYFTFDIYANANNAFTYFDYAALVLEYNTDVFGQNVSTNKKIEIINGSLFDVGTYNSKDDYDITPNVVYLNFGAGFSVNSPRVLLTTTPVELMKIEIELLNNKQGLPSNIKFVELPEHDKASVALYTEDSCSSNVRFYEVNCYSPEVFRIYTVAPTLSSFTPTTTRAGVGESVTINGNNFGIQKGEVLFTKDGIPSGTTEYLKGLDEAYIESWTNTQIRLKFLLMCEKGMWIVKMSVLMV